MLLRSCPLSALRIPNRHTAKTFFLVASILIPAFGFAQKVSLKYDKAADFSQYKTYAWVQGMPAANPTLDAYIKGAVDGMLQKKGLQKAEPAHADLYLTYYAANTGDVKGGGFEDPTNITTGGAPLNGENVWSTAPTMGSAGGMVHKGSLLFEMFDHSKHQMIWAGSASAKLKEKRDERFDQLDKSLIKIFEGYPPQKK